MTHGLSFPARTDGERSTSAFGRVVIADALRPVDPAGALGAEQETSWRNRYPRHLRRLVEAGLATPDAWQQIAAAGLESAHERMVFTGPDEQDRPADSLLTAAATRELRSVEISGTGERQSTFTVPLRGQRLGGDDLRARLDAWVDEGVLEPSAADAVRRVLDHPEWLSLDGHTVTVLGAGAEMGPLRALLSWGATVAAVDLPRPEIWQRLLTDAHRGAGRLLVPVPADTVDAQAQLADFAGADLLTDVPEVADWVAGLDGRPVLGTYLYADGGTHVRLSLAADLVSTRVSRVRPDTALAFLATPTDVFVVPREAVEHSAASYAGRTRTAKTFGRPLRWASRGRLLVRAYPPEADPGIADALVTQQGPNYALAKRMQRWRATTARAAGQTVSFHVAPSTRTRSVVKNRALAAAFAGAHQFGVEVFEPGTSNTLMAALLVHDLINGTPSHPHPWQDEAYAAVHGGLWRAAYEPRSALGLAAVLGIAGSRG